MRRLFRVETDWACFGFETDGGRVVRTAPIAGWMRGKREREVVDYWRRRGARVDLIEEGADERPGGARLRAGR